MNSNDQKRIIKDNRDFISNAEFTALNDVFFNKSSHSEKSLPSFTDLKAMDEIPVQVSAILGRTNIPVKQLLEIVPGSVIKLDRKFGEPIDIYINNQLLARGKLILMDDHLGITITEIMKVERG